MIPISIEAIRKFIGANRLEKADGNLLFDAEVNFYTGNTFHSITSQVQIITLPHEIAIYIMEFLKEEYKVTEMYSTSHYYFTNPEPEVLEIREKHSDPLFVVSLSIPW